MRTPFRNIRFHNINNFTNHYSSKFVDKQRWVNSQKKINCNFLSIYKTYKYEAIHRQLEQLSFSIKTLDTNRNLQEQDRYNLIQQIKILRIALIVVSAIAFISLMLSIISLRR